MAPDPQKQNTPPPGADPNSAHPVSADGGHVINNHAWRIRALGAELVADATSTLEPAKTKLETLQVSLPGFSIIGIPLAMDHGNIKGQVAQFLNQAMTQMRTWQNALDTVAEKWDSAESHSTM
ncbi:MAG: hypothetical protein ACJ72W_23530 [Actinoallomurus sp.]